MPLMSWSDRLSVNISTVDFQHKKLIDLINRTYDALTVENDREAMGKILEELLDYTMYHFATEEGFFKRYSYPGLDAHKAQHDALTAKVMMLKAGFDGGNESITIEAMSFLQTWLLEHIMKSDKAYEPFLASKGMK